MRKIPVVGILEAIHHNSVYKATPLEVALQSCFGEELLFGGKKSRNPGHARVAVISTLRGINGGPVVLANYNRSEETNNKGRSTRCQGQKAIGTKVKCSYIQVCPKRETGQGNEDLGSVSKVNQRIILVLIAIGHEQLRPLGHT